MRSLAALVLLAGVGCAPEVRTVVEGPELLVHHIVLGLPNTWILEAPAEGGVVMIDAGEPNDERDIELGLQALGFSLDDVDLVVVTHGHFDHAGAVAALQPRMRAPFVVGEADLPLVQVGKADAPSVTWEGDVVRAVVDTSFSPFEPTFTVGPELDLAPFGVRGRVLAVPGHTAGSLAVLLPSGDAFVGDLIRGVDGGGEEPHEGHAETHVFSADFFADRSNLERLLGMGMRRFFPGHGAFFDADDLRGWIVDTSTGP